MTQTHLLRVMNTARKLFWIGLLGSSCAAWGAVESVSEVYLAQATAIAGSSGGRAAVSYFSLSIVSPVAYVGSVSAVNANTATDPAPQWPPELVAAPSGTYYAEFDSGTMADLSSMDLASGAMLFVSDIASLVSPGESYRIRKHLTLADVFGANNEAGLQPGMNAAEADNVILHDPQSQQTLTFFYSSVPGFTGWYRDDYTPANDVIIYPEQGIMVRRKSAESLVLYTHGPLKTGASRVPVFPGYNLLGTLQSTRSLTLAELNLYTGDPATGLAAASNPAEADTLIVVNPDSTTRTFFYSDFPGFEGWFDAAYVPAGDVPIAPGSAFFIHRQNSRGLFYWSIPAP